jgi:hypothetical protein
MENTSTAKNNERYCAFVGAPCVRALPEENELKIFFAYPAEQKIQGYISDVCKHKVLTDLTLFPWEKLSDTAGILFCKICAQILESRSIVADITYVNQNVMFELGFAIANWKTPILIKEEHRKSVIIDALQDVKRIEYSDIDALVNKLYHAFFEDFPYSELIDDTTDPLVFFINADANMPVKRPIFKHLDEFCRDCSYKIQVDDSSEMMSHKLLHLLKTINRSEMVVCHMVGVDYKGYNEINAHVAFLAGYALGRQKKILILQEKPSDRMLDLHQVRREYADRKDVIQILENWLKPIRESRLKYLDFEKKSKEHVELKEDLSFTLGKSAAELDVILDECFIDTDDYLAAKNLKNYLFIGRRGAGKTANFLQLSRNFKKASKNIVVEIMPSKLQLISAIDKLYAHVGQGRITALFEMFWQYVLLTEIAIQCQKYEADHNIYMDDPQPFFDVTQLLEAHIFTDSPFDMRFNEMVDHFCDLTLQSKAGDLRTVILQNFYKDYFPKMQAAVKKISDTHPIIVVIDNLDSDWDTKNIPSVSAMINSLFDVMNRINVNHVFGNCNIICFLRADIYQISSKFDVDFDKRQPKILKWDPDSLRALICERIAAAKGLIEDDYDALWQSVFGDAIEPIGNSFEYILERTMLRPRDILTFCTIILENLHKNKKTIVDMQAIQESELSYSEYLLRSIRLEYRIGYPDIQDLCLEIFYEKNATFTESQLKERIQSYVLSNPTYSIDDIIKFCFKTGILGIAIDKITHYEYEGRDFDFLMDRARQNTKGFYFTIHPGVHKFLEIKN